METCEYCGRETSVCVEQAQENMVNYSMMLLAHKQLPEDYQLVSSKILDEWRSHALPECDPLAIS
jgi:hypothetical protein